MLKLIHTENMLASLIASWMTKHWQ